VGRHHGVEADRRQQQPRLRKRRGETR
jgi:hypothetical protein